MKLIINKDYLNESIQHVSKAISGRTTIPILSGIKIDTTQAGVTLTASDTDISIQSFIPLLDKDKTIITLQETGSVVLPANFFMEIIKKLPSQEIEIDVKESFHTVIKSGNSEIQMVGLDPEEYPVMPKLIENNSIVMEASLLKTMIRQTVFSASMNESTPILTGILWNLTEGKLKFTATDRHRLSSREALIDTNPIITFNNIVISAKTLNELSKIIPDRLALVEIVTTDNQVLFKIDHILFYSRLLDGIYPDTSKIIPQTYKTELVINTRKLADSIDRAYLLSREEKTNIVNLITKEDNLIEVSSSSSALGKITDQLEVEQYSGEPLKISFNSKYMLDVLKIIDSETIHIGFTGAMSPIIIKANDHENMLHLILPYRTAN
ncbi:MAG TPA: DNA polymerase III subunit beta [Bacilli bacterium]